MLKLGIKKKIPWNPGWLIRHPFSKGWAVSWTLNNFELNIILNNFELNLKVGFFARI